MKNNSRIIWQFLEIKVIINEAMMLMNIYIYIYIPR